MDYEYHLKRMLEISGGTKKLNVDVYNFLEDSNRSLKGRNIIAEKQFELDLEAHKNKIKEILTKRSGIEDLDESLVQMHHQRQRSLHH